MMPPMSVPRSPTPIGSTRWIAPSIGGVMLDAFNWRAIFATLAGAGPTMIALARLTLCETLPAERRREDPRPRLEAAGVAIAARRASIVRVLRLHQRLAGRAHRRQITRPARRLRCGRADLGAIDRRWRGRDLLRRSPGQGNVRRRWEGAAGKAFHDPHG